MTFLWGLFIGFVIGWVARSIRLIFDPRFTRHLSKQVNPQVWNLEVGPDGKRHSKNKP